MFAKPSDAMKSMQDAVLKFSDQIPLWVKKPITRSELWEIRAPAKGIKAVRQNIKETLAKASQKDISEVPAVQDEKEDQMQLVEKQKDEDDEQWELHPPTTSGDGNKTHTTSLKEPNCDKYRITFEAHQLVTSWFRPSAAPSGHVSRGILIVLWSSCCIGQYKSKWGMVAR